MLGSLTTEKPKMEEEDSNEDYVYLYDAVVDNNLFQIPESPVPGVGNKNPVPLSSFPVTPEPVFDLGKFPVNVPIPLSEAENIGLPSILNTRQADTAISIGESNFYC